MTDLNLSKAKISQLLFIAASIIGVFGLLFLSFYLNGVTATKNWIATHPALTLFIVAAVVSVFPVWKEAEGKLKKIWKETSKTTLIITVASFFVWYRSFLVTPDTAFESALYSLGGKAWYFTGFILILNIIGVPIASALVKK